MQRKYAALLTLLQCFLTLATAVDTECPVNFWHAELNKINSYLDETVQPCDDFFEYSCGNWRAPYQLRALHAHDAVTTLKAGNKQMLINYFVQHWIGMNRTTLQFHDAKRAAFNFYESCLDDKIAAPKKGGLKAYSETLLSISDWPVLNAYYMQSNAVNASFNWQHVSAELQRFGVHSFWRLLVQPNWQTAEQLIFYLAPLQFDSLPHSEAAVDEAEDKLFVYKRYIKYFMLDLNVRVREAKRIADEVVEFELALRALSGSERDYVLRAPQSLAILQQELPTVNLAKYFATFLAADVTEKLRDIAWSQLLIVADKAYLQRLASFLDKANVETIGKYLLVQFLMRFEVHQHEHESYDDQKQECLLQLHNLLPQPLTQLYLELQHESSTKFLQQTQQELQTIFEQLKRQFEKMLNATNIFERDAVTKVLGLEKLRAMRLLLPTVESLNQADNVEMTQDYDRNLLQLAKLRVAKEVKPILQSLAGATHEKLPPDVDFLYGPLDVNAYYRLKKNTIELPVGILRAPFYDRCLASPKIYGCFIYIVAHELLHGFDYDGLNYDKSGNVANSWGAKSIIQFGNKSSCYMTARYPNAPRNINENIADSEGLRLALETFVESSSYVVAQQQQQQQQLQLFFTSFAQTWCGTAAGNRLSSLHASHKGRVNNVVSNFPEFAEAFKCRAGSAMHPAEKCRIW